jgi:hypothetical protein
MNAERRNCMKRKTIAQQMAVFCLPSPRTKKAVQPHQPFMREGEIKKHGALISQDECWGKKNINPLNICDYQLIVV